MSCPELARAEMAGLVPDTKTPESALGTAVHAGIESLLNGHGTTHAYEAAQETLQGLMPPIPATGHKWSKVNVHDLALDCIDAWDSGVKDAGLRKQIVGDVLGVEHQFDTVVLDTDQFVVRLRGTTDLVTSTHLWDWKTSARKWQQWEEQRYNLQASCYVLGVRGLPDKGEVLPFRFGVINPDTLFTQVVEITRSRAHILALVDQIHSIAVMIHADLPRWPLAGKDWKCSKKWCPLWNECRGAHGLDW